MPFSPIVPGTTTFPEAADSINAIPAYRGWGDYVDNPVILMKD